MTITRIYDPTAEKAIRDVHDRLQEGRASEKTFQSMKALTNNEFAALQSAKTTDEWYRIAEKIFADRDGEEPSDWQEKTIETGIFSRMKARQERRTTVVIYPAFTMASVALSIIVALWLWPGEAVVALALSFMGCIPRVARRDRISREKKLTDRDIWDPVAGTYVTPEKPPTRHLQIVNGGR